MSLELALSIGITSFLFLYFSFNLSKEENGQETHFFLKIIMLFFFIISLLLLSKVAIDDFNSCPMQIANITTSGAVQTYEYREVCTDVTGQTSDSFYRMILWFIRVFIVYFFLYLIYTWTNFGDKIDNWLKGR